LAVWSVYVTGQPPATYVTPVSPTRLSILLQWLAVTPLPFTNSQSIRHNITYFVYATGYHELKIRYELIRHTLVGCRCWLVELLPYWLRHVVATLSTYGISWRWLYIMANWMFTRHTPHATLPLPPLLLNIIPTHILLVIGFFHYAIEYTIASPYIIINTTTLRHVATIYAIIAGYWLLVIVMATLFDYTLRPHVTALSYRAEVGEYAG